MTCVFLKGESTLVFTAVIGDSEWKKNKKQNRLIYFQDDETHGDVRFERDVNVLTQCSKI